jgi:hypothetical protein
VGVSIVPTGSCRRCDRLIHILRKETMKKLSLWQPKAIVRHDDEIIEGEIVEEKNNRGITRSGGRAANLTVPIEKDPYRDYWQDPFLLKMDKARAEEDARLKAKAEKELKEFEAQQAKQRRVKPEYIPKLAKHKPFKGNVLLPDGTKVEFNSKEEEAAIIRKHWR